MCSLEFYFGLQFVFVFLSYYLFFFFSMIVKHYSIAYKDSLHKYNVILLYIMAWIIWFLTYDYISYFDASFSHFIFYFSFEKGDYSLSLSLSLSLSIYIYIYIIYSFLQPYFRFMNHCIFFYIILFWVNTIWYCVWFFKFSVTSLHSPSFNFCFIFYFLDIILSYFGSEILN